MYCVIHKRLNNNKKYCRFLFIGFLDCFLGFDSWIIYPWAVYWEGPSAFFRGGEGRGRRRRRSKNFCEKFFCPDFDAEYNGEIEIWIRLPVLQQNSGKTFRSKIEELDSFRNGLFDLEDFGLILTGIFFARNVGKNFFFLNFFYPPKCKNKNLGCDFLTPKWGLIILKRSEKRQGIFFALEKFWSESP